MPLSPEQALARIQNGDSYVVRLRSDGSEERRVKFDDMIKGTIEMPENDEDFVLLKSDGVPTYHFAHAVDDHLMRTTHVVRGDEWLPSLPFHIQLFKALGFKLPKYLHIGPLMKMDGNSKRKLSKRKDPEAAVEFFFTEGYPKEALIDYLLMLLNSNYEEWRSKNPDSPYTDFQFSIKKMSNSGCLIDFEKLGDISKNVLSRFTAEQIYDGALEWSRAYDGDFARVLENDKAKAIAVFSIGRGGKKPRKDFGRWSEVKPFVSFFYDEYFAVEDKIEGFEKADIAACLKDFASSYDETADQSAWFENIKRVSAENGFCPDMKQYKADPSAFKGSVADVSSFIRVAVTGRLNSPDLYTVMNVLGKKTTLDRVDAYIRSL